MSKHTETKLWDKNHHMQELVAGITEGEMSSSQARFHSLEIGKKKREVGLHTRPKSFFPTDSVFWHSSVPGYSECMPVFLSFSNENPMKE